MRNKKLEQLKIFYVFVFILGAIIIAPTHLFPQPFFMPFRFPYYLEKMRPFLGISWPLSFEIYHFVLYALAIIVSLNVLGILLYPRFKNVGIFSSLIGIFIFSLIKFQTGFTFQLLQISSDALTFKYYLKMLDTTGICNNILLFDFI